MLGIIHGGLTAALCDELSGAASFVTCGPLHFTANLTLNYLKPIVAGQYILVRASVVSIIRRKVYVNVTVENGRGRIFAKGTALFIRPNQNIDATTAHHVQ